MCLNELKICEYINFDEIREKYMKHWNIGNGVPDNLQDKITINKDLFFSLLWNESTKISKELNKDILEVTFVDIITHLFSTNNLTEVVSVTRKKDFNDKNNIEEIFKNKYKLNDKTQSNHTFT